MTTPRASSRRTAIPPATRCQPRVMPGVPAGGQFTGHPRTEPGVALAPPPPAEPLSADPVLADQDLISRQPAAPGRNEPPRPRPAVSGYLGEFGTDEEWRRARDAALRSAGTWARRNNRGLEHSEDAAQDAMVAALVKQRNGHTITNLPGFAANSAGWEMARRNIRLSAEDRKARGMMFDQIAALEAAEQRQARTADFERIGQRIRDRWPDPRHRPTQRFWLTTRQVELADQMTGPGTGAGDDAVDSDSWAAVALTRAGETGGDLDAKLLAYNSLAALSGTPEAVRSSMSQRQVTRCRATIRDYPGGISAAASRWRQGETDEGTEALFAPFGGIDEHGRDRVAGLLDHHPDEAQPLWESALQFANTTHSPKVARLTEKRSQLASL